MASEQFSLCWDNFHKNMSSGMNSLLESEDLVDVTLAVEGKYLKAHKMVLSVCSPYFRELFKTNPCKHPIVFMKDVSYVAMSDLLQFMYQGEVQVSQENLTTFIKTAEALQIKGLTGDGNGSTECDNEQDESVKPAEIEPPKLAPLSRAKKLHQPATPPAPKRPRLSTPSQPQQEQQNVTTPAKTEPSSSSVPQHTTSAPSTTNELVQFKMEPYDQGQSSASIPDDSVDETFNEDPLDDTNADDGNEDYSMMEGGDEEPQAGTSADGTAGEGQVSGVIHFLQGRSYKHPLILLNGDEFFLHQKRANSTRWRCRAYHKTKCRSALCTYGRIVKIFNDHNHMPCATHHDTQQLVGQNVIITWKH